MPVFGTVESWAVRLLVWYGGGDDQIFTVFAYLISRNNIARVENTDLEIASNGNVFGLVGQLSDISLAMGQMLGEE